MSARPKLLYFHGPWDHLGDRLRVSYVDVLDGVLEQDFDVISIAGNRDFALEIERHHPDLVLFHSGVEAQKEPVPTITNTAAYPEVPRIGYVLRDPSSPTRLDAVDRLQRWGVEQIFTAFRPSDSPEGLFAGAIYVPWWIDDRVFRDYGEEKVVPIAATGGGWLPASNFYPWRFALMTKLLPMVPVFHVPVFQPHESGHAFVGENYARLLNQSLFAAGCGSANRYLTRKPLEIPACRSCLITEETEVMKALGFRDGVNCVFATPDDVVEKVNALLDDAPRLRQITDAGFDLVHARHTQRHRRMFVEWYRLRLERGPGQHIVQLNPFGPLLIANEAEPVSPLMFPAENPLIADLREGYRLVALVDWSAALLKFNAVVAAESRFAEARLGAAICELRLGRVDRALKHLLVNAHIEEVSYHGSRLLDVLNLCYLSMVLQMVGKKKEAAKVLARMNSMSHPALDALRDVLRTIEPQLRRCLTDSGDKLCPLTLHILPKLTYEEWRETWLNYLTAPKARSLTWMAQGAAS